ncbi:MAG: OmpA family protein [Pseudomonadota bacterium]
MTLLGYIRTTIVRGARRCTPGIRAGVSRTVLIAFVIWSCALQGAVSATPPGTAINNVARVTFNDVVGNPVTVASNVATVTTVFGRTPATVSFSRLLQTSNALSERQGPVRCLQNGTFAPLAAPLDTNGQPIDLMLAQPAVQAGIYNTDETVFVRLADGDQNLNPNLRESVEVSVRHPASGDSETLLLLETDRNTGVFTGYLPLGDNDVISGNCRLQASVDSALSVDYTDPADSNDTTAASALIEPLSLVFDAITGLPVDGAVITIVDASSGLPASVFGNDGISAYPSTVTSGAPVTDASGVLYQVPTGGFRFPVLPAGDYRLVVTPPSGYLAPSIRSVDELASLPNAPFDIDDASFSLPFNQAANGAASLVDFPLDPFDGGLFVSKTTNSTQAAVGDFVAYTVTIENSSSRGPATNIVLTDTPALGLRFVADSARLDDNPVADPVMSGDGSGSFRFTLPTLAAQQRATLTYVMEVTGAVRGKRLENRVLAAADGDLVSNVAAIAIRVREDLLRSRSTLIGRVVEANCGVETLPQDTGVQGVRVYLEDGRFAVTDEAGRFHLEGLQPGRHTVQLDTVTVPEWLELAPCDNAPRFGGRAFSQWVDLAPGLLQRADFYLKRIAAEEGEVSLQLVNQPGTNTQQIRYQLHMRGTGNVSLEDVSATVLLPQGATLEPASVRLDGERLPSPRAAGNALVFVLGQRDGQWRNTLSFVANVDPTFAGELDARAVLNFKSPTDNNARTPVAEARMLREAATSEQADYVLALNFDVLSADLSASDRAELDVLIDAWRGVGNIRITAVGHTDSDRIAATNRRVFADNYALSEARARAAARYLADALGVPARQVEARGVGPDKPVADNATVEGKRRNRRVELIMTGLRAGRQAAVEVTREASDIQRAATVGARPGPDTQIDRLDLRIQQTQDLAAAIDTPEVPATSEWPSNDGFVLPDAQYQPAIPSLTVALLHPADTRIELSLNGKPVSALNFDGVGFSDDKRRLLSQWRGVDLVEGTNTLVAQQIDETGVIQQTWRRVVHYAGQPVRGELALEDSRLIADGRVRPVIAVRLFDGDNRPARAASVGGYRIDAPYRSWFEVARERENNLVRLVDREQLYRVGPDGIAFIELEPTTQAGEVTLRLQFNNDREQEVRAYLKPAPRDWILVGFAEGTVGYNTLRDNVAFADAAGLEDELYEDGRVAFFAKGRVGANTLLTLAYDTRGSAVDRDELLTEVDPDAFFTLYGDGTESRFEAPSQRKLYVKLERQQFSALFGDYSTGLSTTELSRYERRFNGFQTQYFGRHVTFNAFAADTDQAFTRDDIQGNGTSGLYRLSGRDLVINSEQVRIETRDRFNANVVVATRRLTRYLDYDIDYVNGTLFFKRPIPSRDQELNPQIIVAEYEARNAGRDDVTAGGRAALKLFDNALELGLSAVQEENAVDANILLGADMRVQLGAATTLRMEYADTDRDDVGGSTSGYAYSFDLQHNTGRVDARVFHNLSDGGFGLGQQAGNQLGIEQSGANIRWQVSERWLLQTQLAWQENLDNGITRKVGDAEARYDDGRNSFWLGAAGVEDETSDGSRAESMLVRAGVSRRLFGDKLTLRLSGEQALSDGDDQSVDYPNRILLGADWNLTKATLFAEHEIADGRDIDAQTTRIGVRATPWQRAQFTTTLDNQISEFGPRLLANIGLLQGMQLSERWTIDVGVDHSNTLIGADALILDPQRPLASGGIGADFVSAFVGALYQSDAWSLNSRIEHRNSDLDASDTLVLGWYREPSQGHGFSVGVQYLDTERDAGGQQRRGDLRFGWAFRLAERQWAFLNRTDLVLDETITATGETRRHRFVNNFNAVRRLSAGRELALQYAAKYVRDELFGISVSGYTDLIGISYRAPFARRWEYQLNAGALHGWRSETLDYSVGAQIGFNPADNLWLSFGYNLAGFRDPDFDAARYTAAGPFLRVTIKADQHTLKAIAGRIRGR